MRIGNRVVALGRITEQNFAGQALHVHAEPGDLGTVVDDRGDLPTVRFDCSGTVTDCDESEIGLPFALRIGVRSQIREPQACPFVS